MTKEMEQFQDMIMQYPSWVTNDEYRYFERRKYFLNFIIDNCWDSTACKYTSTDNVIKEMNKVLAQEFPVEHKKYFDDLIERLSTAIV